MAAGARYLLDVNVLIALAWPNHVHHAAAHRWFGRRGGKAWATCPLTQLAFMRISSNGKIIAEAVQPREARSLLQQITEFPGHAFWPDAVTPLARGVFDSLALVGHRQVMDAYLLALVEHHRGCLATFDGGVRDLIADPKQRALRVECLA